MGTLTIEQSRLHMHIAFDLILCESCGWATLDSRDVSQLKFYAEVAASPLGSWRVLSSWQYRVPPPQLHHRALITSNTEKTAVSDPLSVPIMPRSHRQPWGCRVRLIHATSPRRSVPSTKSDMILVIRKHWHIPNDNDSVI